MSIPEYKHEHKAQFEKLEGNQDQIDAMRYANYKPEDDQLFKPEMFGEACQQIHSCKGNESEYHTEGKMKHCQEGPGLWVVRCNACNKPFIVEVGGKTAWVNPKLIQYPTNEERTDGFDYRGNAICPNVQGALDAIGGEYKRPETGFLADHLNGLAEHHSKQDGLVQEQLKLAEMREKANNLTLTESEVLSFAAWYSDRCNEGSDYAGELTTEAWRAEQ